MDKKILELSLSPDLGGLELFMVHCYNYFQKKCDCKIVVAPEKKLDAYLKDSKKLHLKRNKFFPLIPAYRLAKIIDNNAIDIVHFHWTKDMATVVLAKILSKRKVKIVQSRHMTMTRFKDDVYHRWLYKNIDMIHAVTMQVAEQLKKFIPEDIRPRITMVYSGVKEVKIDAEELVSLRGKYNLKDSFVIGIVGRIEDKKGQWIVIEALSKLREFNIKVLIIGHAMDEEYLKFLKQKVKELEIEQRVIFTGFSKKVNEHIKLCDVTVLATPKETFGLVVIESMVNGVPVIATNKGGPLEIIEDGVDGLFFDRSVEDLVKKLKMLYKDKMLRIKLANNAYKKAKNKFDFDTLLDELYKNLTKDLNEVIL